MTVSNPSVQNLVDKWQTAGLFSCGMANLVLMTLATRIFRGNSEHLLVFRHVITQLSSKLIWKEEGLWHLKSQGGENLGTYGVADKALGKSQPGFASPLEHAGVPDLYEKMAGIKSIPCFAVMLAFPHHLTSVPYDTFIVECSDLLGGAFRVSRKPGRTVLLNSYWVLQSTINFAEKIIEKEGLTSLPMSYWSPWLKLF